MKRRERERGKRSDNKKKVVMDGQGPAPEGWETNVLASTTKIAGMDGSEERRGEGKEKEQQQTTI